MIRIMGSYYYIKGKNSELGYTPVLEEEYIEAIFRIAKKKGVKITEAKILKEIECIYKKGKRALKNLTKSKENGNINLLKSPALVR